MKNRSLILPMLLVFVMLTGCAPISLVDSWKDSGTPVKQYRKLLVVGITDKRQMREVFEEVFAAEFVKKGVTAIPSYTMTGGEVRPTRASLEEAVKKSGADGVITTRLVALKRDTTVHAGYIITDRGYTNASFSDSSLYPVDLFGFYGTTIQYATFENKPVDVTVSTVATIETNLFNAGTGSLVWSGTTSAVKPEGIITVSGELAQVVITAMARQGLI